MHSGRDEVARTFAAHAIVPLVNRAELTRIHRRGKIGELVDDRVGHRAANGRQKAVAIKHISHDSLGTGSGHRGSPGRHARHRDDRVSRGDELRKQASADGAARSRDEDSHATSN